MMGAVSTRPEDERALGAPDPMKPIPSISHGFLAGGALAFALACPVASALTLEDDKPQPTATFSDADADNVHKLLFEGKAAEVVKMLESHPAVAAKQRKAEIPYALALLRTGREREATTIAWRYKRTTETDLDALELVGYVLFAAGQYDQAKSYFKLAQLYVTDSKDRTDIEPAFNLARCDAYMRLDDASATALRAFESQRDQLPKGLVDESIGRLAVKRAEKNVAAGLYDDATVEFLDQAVAFLPNDVAVHNMLAGVLIQRADYVRAEEVIATMERKFDSNLELVQTQRALIQEKKGNLEQAMRLAGDAITLSGRKLLPALIIYSRCALRLDRYDDARRPLDDAINVSPTSLEARLLMAEYLFHRVRNTGEAKDRTQYLEQIERHLRQAINVEPMAVEPFEQLVQLYTLWGDKKKFELSVAQKDLENRVQVRAMQQKAKKS